MNKENILLVADAIEKHSIEGLGFNMGDFISHRHDDLSGHDCGTTACIAGWAASIAKEFTNGEQLYSFHFGTSIRGTAARFLGLTDADIVYKLFTPDQTDLGKPSPYTADSAKAVRVLRHLAATGEVDWSV